MIVLESVFFKLRWARLAVFSWFFYLFCLTGLTWWLHLRSWWNYLRQSILYIQSMYQSPRRHYLTSEVVVLTVKPRTASSLAKKRTNSVWTKFTKGMHVQSDLKLPIEPFELLGGGLSNCIHIQTWKLQLSFIDSILSSMLYFSTWNAKMLQTETLLFQDYFIIKVLEKFALTSTQLNLYY